MRVVPVLAAAAFATAAVATVTTAPAAADPDERSTYSFAVIRDVPGGAAQVAAFPDWIEQINADRSVRSVVHLAAGSPWLTTYGVTGSADNLTRVTVDGSANNHDYLRVIVAKEGSPDLLSWTPVPYTS